MSGKKMVAALAGNPNVGKSTLFNRLTNLRQHTGNWPGKTVGSAYGSFEWGGREIVLADIPGTYSLVARSGEEERARDELLFGGAEKVVVVCDAGNLERNLILALQIMEISGGVVLCVNLIDEAARRGISVDTARLEERLGIPVTAICAASGEGVDALCSLMARPSRRKPAPCCCGELAQAVEPLVEYFEKYHTGLPPLWLALRLCEGDESFTAALCENLGLDLSDEEAAEAFSKSRENLQALGLGARELSDLTARRLHERARAVCEGAVHRRGDGSGRDRKIDRVLTHPVLGPVSMLALLAGVLWLTIAGANYPSEALMRLLFSLGEALGGALDALGAPETLCSLLLDGVYKTVAWVVSVMLPPMAIFFPLFTLLEDLGLLPRIAFNLDGAFKSCGACGKQALTMCMGFGCNAAAVVGCRIIDSPRERLIALLTNSLVPCNGRFPTMIALVTVFFAGGAGGGAVGALLMTLVVLLGILATFLASKILSRTVLRGTPSSFTLELPPYRRPRVGEVIVRSVLDRTLFVLARAVKAAAPAGVLIWLLGNVRISGEPLLAHAAAALDAPASLLGLDGAIILAFVFALPANEIVMPMILMCYLSGGSLVEYSSLAELREILLANGWTALTGLCVIVFSLLHWPCATTLMTIKKETGSVRYTLLAAALPTAFGAAACAVISLAGRLIL